MATKDNNLLNGYFLLIKNLDTKSKLNLISKISQSILEEEKKKENLLNCFGAFKSEESADEIIEKIYKARKFSAEDISL
jgi:hypothetical protein